MNFRFSNQLLFSCGYRLCAVTTSDSGKITNSYEVTDPQEKSQSFQNWESAVNRFQNMVTAYEKTIMKTYKGVVNNDSASVIVTAVSEERARNVIRNYTSDVACIISLTLLPLTPGKDVKEGVLLSM